MAVFPLVCAVCARVVGAINVDAFVRMQDRHEVYCCSRCAEGTGVEVVVGDTDEARRARGELLTVLHREPEVTW